MRRLVLIAGLALLCLAPIVGAALQPSDLSARPISQDVTTLPGPTDSN